MKIQGLTYIKRHHEELIVSLFKHVKKPILPIDIRSVLRRNGLTQKYFRYVPEIYYLLNELQPVCLTQQQSLKMHDLYKKITNYEKYQRVKLPSSKRYFIHYYLGKSYYDVFLPKTIPIMYADVFKKCIH